MGLLKDLSWKLGQGDAIAPDGLPFPPPHLCFVVSANYDPWYFYENGLKGAESIRGILQQNNEHGFKSQVQQLAFAPC
jgi:hypothetical protein